MQVNIAVGVVTFKRVGLLKKLLVCLNKQEIFFTNFFKLTVIVINNDKNLSVEQDVNECLNLDKWNLIYSEEHKNGVVFARNKLLEVLPSNTDYLLMIDDDEQPVPTWINNHICTILKYNADLSSGPVIPDYESHPDKWIIDGKFHERARFKTGSNPGITRTGNLCISKQVIDFQLAFDMRLNRTGGEDSLYIENLIKLNMKHVWCDEAIVYEFVPNNRLNLKWLCFRSMRIGNSGVKYRLILNRNIKDFLISYVKTLILLFFSCTFLLLYPCLDKVKKSKVLIFASKVKGRIYAHFGKDINEY